MTMQEMIQQRITEQTTEARANIERRSLAERETLRQHITAEGAAGLCLTCPAKTLCGRILIALLPPGSEAVTKLMTVVMDKITAEMVQEEQENPLGVALAVLEQRARMAEHKASEQASEHKATEQAKAERKFVASRDLN